MDNLQKKWLEKEKNMEITNFQFKLCLGTPSGTPGKWVPWEEWDWKIHPRVEFRTICQNEVLLDLDIDDEWELYFTALLLRERLIQYKIPFYVYDSGGKGYHFQIWLKASNPEIIDWKAVRNRFVRIVAKDILYRTKIGNFWRWNLDPRKWNWSRNGSGSVVRVVGGKKKRVKFMIPEILPPIDRKRITVQRFPTEDFQFEYFNLPPEMLVNCEEQQNVPEFNLEKFLAKSEIPICIESLIEEQESGFHSCHMQRISIVAYLWRVWKARNKDRKMEKSDFDEIKKIFSKDPEYKESITDFQIRNVVASLENSPWKVPKCKYLRNEGLIDNELCDLCKITKTFK